MAWVVVIPFALWTVIRFFGLDGGYPLEAMMPFTPYVAAASVAAFALALALRRRAPAAIAAAAPICLGVTVLPRQDGDETVSAAGHPTLNVLAANVHEGGASPAGLLHLDPAAPFRLDRRMGRSAVHTALGRARRALAARR